MEARRLRSHGRLALLLATAGQLLWAGVLKAGDPLDDVDGTEDWSSTKRPKKEERKEQQIDRNAFRLEVADWENVRQLWQREREDYITEKTRQKRLMQPHRGRPDTAVPKSAPKAVPKSTKRVVPEADIHEDNLYDDSEEWGDAPGQRWFESSSSADRAVDAELGESGAIPKKKPEPKKPIRKKPVTSSDSSLDWGDEENGSPQPDVAAEIERKDTAAEIERKDTAAEIERKDTAAEIERKDTAAEIERTDTAAEIERTDTAAEIERGDPEAEVERAVARMKAEEEARKAREEQERLKREEEERRRKEAEAEAGEAAAAELLRRQEEDLRKEQERIRKKAKLEIDGEGQMVDPELKKEIDDDPGEKEEED